ncbi:ABC transporter ATP-binding protein [Streptomyces rochei]|nr:ABC transporter ATP-binding protein [Streptomyces rochei]
MKLIVDRLHVTLDRNPILRGVSLEVGQGDVVGLVGPNGSGKFTLLRTVYRALRPAAGVVRVGDDDVWELSPRAAARRTAAVLQDTGGNTTGLTVTEIVALGRAPHHGLLGRDGTEDHEAVSAAIDRCGVRPFADRDLAPPCPAASGNASCWPGRWPRTPNSSSWTNSPTTWTSAPGSSCWT